ncbi:MAG: transposase [Thermodesulfobacteriota bacterium]|nr:transposase [Thermodesulfobacteriota bacterium]
MSRLARLDAPGVLHHVIIRGIKRRNIFEDNKDRDNLLRRLGELLPVTKTSCYAWAMLSNHAHFLLLTGRTGLSIVMKRLLTGYVVSFNRRHLRHGPLLTIAERVCEIYKVEKEDIYSRSRHKVKSGARSFFFGL